MKKKYGIVSEICINKLSVNKAKQHFKDMKGAFTHIENIFNKDEINENDIEELIHLITYLRHYSLNCKNELLENVKIISC